MEVHLFMKQLKAQKHMLTVQQYRTLKGQALAGDVLCAMRGLTKLLGRRAVYVN